MIKVETNANAGIRKENIDIDINKDGNRITISRQNPVQEMVSMGWIIQKQEGIVRDFEKSFRIPDGVKLDRIKAKFNHETSVLTIRMPKQVKGITGVRIEEVEEEGMDRVEQTDNVVNEVPETEGLIENQVSADQHQLQDVVADEIPGESRNLSETIEDSGLVVDQVTNHGPSKEAKFPERDDDNEEKPEENRKEAESRELENKAKAEPEHRVQEPIEESNKPLQEQPGTEPENYLEAEADNQTTKDNSNAENKKGGEETEATTCPENPTPQKVNENQESSSEDIGQGKKNGAKKSKVYTPILVAGSAIIVSIIVLVFHVRAKKR